MTRVRLLPVLIFGLVSLLSIKLMSIAVNLPADRLTMSPGAADPFSRSITMAREGVAADPLITGSVGKKDEKKDEKKETMTPAEKAEQKAADEKARAEMKARQEPEGVRYPPPNAPDGAVAANASPAERALLEKLKDRRNEIETRDRELEMRDSLLRVGERKLDDKIGELRSLEGQLGAAAGKNDPKTRYKPLVVMYESMKPKEAARVFDRLDVKILIDLVGHMNPRKVSEILAVMDPSAAEKLTVALAKQAAQGDALLADAAAGQPDSELPRLPVPGAPKR